MIEYSADFDPVLPPSDRLLEEITSVVSHTAAAVVAIDRSTVAQRIKPDLSPANAAIVAAAGDMVVKPDGKPLAYGQGAEDYRVSGFVACGDHTVAEHLFGAQARIEAKPF